MSALDPLSFLFVVWFGYLVVVLLIGLGCYARRPIFIGPLDMQTLQEFDTEHVD